MFYQGFVDFLRDGFRACDSGNEEGVLGEVSRVFQGELVGQELVSLLRTEIDIIFGVVCEVWDHVRDQAAEGELFARGSHGWFWKMRGGRFGDEMMFCVG